MRYVGNMKKKPQLEFAQVVAVAAKEIGVRQLALEFAVAPSTVSRWASGIAVPHPMIQVHVLEALEGRIGVAKTTNTNKLVAASER